MCVVSRFLFCWINLTDLFGTLLPDKHVGDRVFILWHELLRIAEVNQERYEVSYAW
jgi:hypothetical protein